MLGELYQRKGVLGFDIYQKM